MRRRRMHCDLLEREGDDGLLHIHSSRNHVTEIIYEKPGVGLWSVDPDLADELAALEPEQVSAWLADHGEWIDG